MFWYDTALMLQWIMVGCDDNNNAEAIMRSENCNGRLTTWCLGTGASRKVVSDDRKAIMGSVSLFYNQWSTLEMLNATDTDDEFAHIWAKSHSSFGLGTFLDFFLQVWVVRCLWTLMTSHRVIHRLTCKDSILSYLRALLQRQRLFKLSAGLRRSHVHFVLIFKIGCDQRQKKCFWVAQFWRKITPCHFHQPP